MSDKKNLYAPSVEQRINAAMDKALRDRWHITPEEKSRFTFVVESQHVDPLFETLLLRPPVKERQANLDFNVASGNGIDADLYADTDDVKVNPDPITEHVVSEPDYSMQGLLLDRAHASLMDQIIRDENRMYLENARATLPRASVCVTTVNGRTYASVCYPRADETE